MSRKTFHLNPSPPSLKRDSIWLRIALACLLAPGLAWLAAWLIGLTSYLFIWSGASAAASQLPYLLLLMGGIVGVVLAITAIALNLWAVHIVRRGQVSSNTAGWWYDLPHRWRLRSVAMLGIAMAAVATIAAAVAALSGADAGGAVSGLQSSPLTAFLSLMGGVVFLAMIVLPTMLAIRLVNSRNAHLNAFGIRWPVSSIQLRRWALLAVIVVTPISLFTILGFAVSVIVVFMQVLAVLALLFRPKSSAAAFAVLTIFVISILSFNSLRGISTLITTPIHLISVGSLLLLHRDQLRARPERLRLLVRWGVAMALTLLLVQIVLLAINLPLGLELASRPSLTNSAPWISDLYVQRGFIGSGSPLINFTYLGFNIHHGLLAAGLLLLLPGRLPAWARRSLVLLVVLLAAVAIAAPFLLEYYPVSPLSNIVP